MATKRDLLKEAIADAKAVKEMAIANAKVALEESFGSQLKSMISLKLQELDEEDTSEMYETEAIDAMKDEMEEDLDLNELLNELNEEESEEEESEEEESEEEGKPLELEDMTDEDLKKMIEDVIADMIAAGELEAGEEEESEEEVSTEMGPEDEEEINLDELLAEIEGIDEDLYEAEGEDIDDALKSALDSGELDKADLAAALKDAQTVAATISETASPEELKAEVEALKRKSSIQKIASILGYTTALVAGGFLVAGIFGDADKAMAAGADQVIDMSKEAIVGMIGILSGLGLGIGKSAQRYGTQQAIASKEKQLSKELEEAYSTIENLRNDLNEVNLLNAKLLYSNKIFKSKTLTESQKVKVLSSFDKANTVGEVKMVYETLNEGIKVKSPLIKENLGSASKITGTTKTKQPIVESNDMVNRFQKLAGII